MGAKTLPVRVHRTHPGLLGFAVALVLIGLWCGRSLLYDAYTLAALPLIWSRHARSFYLSARHDNFDVTFANYSVDQTSATPYPDLVPPVIHHISLGSGAASHANWAEVRQSCLDMHPGWDAFLWTDETADSLVADHFPELHEMWTTYRYPIQKIDALRYMVLYRYGGWCSPRDPVTWLAGLDQLTDSPDRRRPGHGPPMQTGIRPSPTIRVCRSGSPPHRVLDRLHDGKQGQRIRRKAREEPRAIQQALAGSAVPHRHVQHRVPLRFVSFTRTTAQTAGHVHD